MTPLFKKILSLLCATIILGQALHSNAFLSIPLTKTRAPTTTHATITTIESLLEDNGFGERLKTISSKDLPLTAELYDCGSCEFCTVVNFEPPKKQNQPPRAKVQIFGEEETRIVDFGQFITIWEDNKIIPHEAPSMTSHQHPEGQIQELYAQVSRRSKSPTLTKKQIPRLVKKIVDDGQQSQQHADVILRKVLKAGQYYRNLVDSSSDLLSSTRLESAMILAQEEQLGGRFKRFGCIYVSHSIEENICITLINGGWMAVDAGVRAVTEAQKFVKRLDAPATSATPTIRTVADERILFRLECLAMGETFFESSTAPSQLEVDVRETLKACQLPLSPKGAQTLLVQMGHWSNRTSTNIAGSVTPWSDDILQAASQYAKADAKRRIELASSAGAKIENRVDLTKLPSICIDQAKTSFRDDALGIRQRSKTGRRVSKDASQWEILIHITDVSDIYCSESSENNLISKKSLKLLETAAMTRGQSRYDLPLGPLHLLPPMVLKSLGFVTKQQQKNNLPQDEKYNLPNRCVTLWIYLDERNGKIIDSGLERTLISPPVALTYQEATDLLKERDNLKKGTESFQLALMLHLLERNLGMFSDRRRQTSTAARRREERLATKELLEASQQSNIRKNNSFKRSRGHRLVDASLDCYAAVLSRLLKGSPIPRSSGSGSESRGGRVATAPLRRYIDGMAQRQALAVLCGYGGAPLTKKDCVEINQRNNEAIMKLDNLRPLKQRNQDQLQQKRALLRLRDTASDQAIFKGVSTGRSSEVTLPEYGALGKIVGLRTKLQSGQEVPVQIKKLDVQQGKLLLEYAGSNKR